MPSSSCNSDRDTVIPGKMWIKNVSITMMNSFHKKTKLQRLDNTEVSSENHDTDYLPSVNVITRESVCQQDTHVRERRNFLVKPVTSVRGISPYEGILHNLISSQSSSVLTKFDRANMYSNNFNKTRSWVPLQNPHFGCPNKWMPYQNNLGCYYKNNFDTPSQNTLKVPLDSPWLQVDSGYLSSQNKGKNGYFRPNIHHNYKSKHKNTSNSKNKEEGKKGSPEKVSSAINGDHYSVYRTGSKEDTQKTSENINVVSKKSFCETESNPCPLEMSPGHDTSKTIESKVFTSINVCKPEIAGESNTSSSPKLENAASPDDSIPRPVCNSNQTCDSIPPIPFKVNIQVNSGNQHRHTISQVHLSIISKKNQNNKQRIAAHQETQVTPESKTKCDDKNAQKNCSICTAYITRVTPECTDFPKSAGCKHSIILLVRDNAKKTKRRRTKEKTSVCQSSPKSFIVGVNSSQNSDNSHVFRFIASDSSDTDDSWDSCDENEVDGDVTDWSNIEMDDIFPENNLLNPMNFKVHISSIPQASAKDPYSSTENDIETVNLSWNIQILDTSDKSSSCSVTKKNKHKKVHFANDNNLAVVHPIVAWSYAYRASRKGPWEEFARDRERFRRRIEYVDNILSEILTESHRSHMYNLLHCGVAINK